MNNYLQRRTNMYKSIPKYYLIVLLSVACAITLAGCAVTRGQSTVGQYVDDSAITTGIKARFVDSKSVDASSISVETLKGEVMLSGFSKSSAERQKAQEIAYSVKGVSFVKNAIVIRTPTE